MAKKIPEINASSMADISFLLLIFFLVTTSMDVNQGLARRLPPPIPPDQKNEEKDIKDRDLFEVKINAANQLLVEREILDISQLREKAMEFIVNPNNDENMPELFEEDFGAPFGVIKVTKGHVISVQSAVDTKYEAYLEVQNALGRAYNEIRDECAQKYYHKKYTELDEEQQKKIQEIYPMKISVAKPRKYRVR